jgi:hypothetical protein
MMSTVSGSTVVPYACLGPTGWTTSLAEKADGLLSDFFATNSNQSIVFSGNLSSLPNIVRSFFTRPVQLVNTIQQVLENYLSRAYPGGVAIDVTSPATNPSFAGGPFTVTIRMLVTELGVQYNLGYLLTLTNSVAITIARINNTGS